MKGDPCSVCGSTDLNLVDGFYYCVECGTQDDNVRETVVDFTKVNETILRTAKSKIYADRGPEMTSEWYKWHTYNFILSGLADEMIALGAKPSFKAKLLWIWGRYIKMFQVDNLGESKFSKQKRKIEEKLEAIYYVPEGNDLLDDTTATEQCSSRNTKPKGVSDHSIFNNADSDRSDDDDNEDDPTPFTDNLHRGKSINNFTVSVMHAMIYTALNLDESDIQLSHILKFVRDGRLSNAGCTKYIPKQMKVDEIPSWTNFIKSTRNVIAWESLGSLVMDCFDVLKLGTPNIPSMKKIVDEYIKELCLPDDFNKLVYSLMHKTKWRHQILKWKPGTRFMTNFGALAMAYIVMALKICFGLDDEYEINISDAVERYNELNNYAKSYTFDAFNEDTNRLFSFREWTNYLQYRKLVLCKFYSGHAIQHNRDLNDYLFIAQNPYQPKLHRMKPVRDISHEVTMDIINKIAIKNEDLDKFKIDFPPSLTPLSTYTEILCVNVEDPDLKLLLSENFSKYSLKYATTYLYLPYERKKNVIIGVQKNNKILNKIIYWNRKVKGYDEEMVYIKNCDNKNWMHTNAPKVEHISEEKDEESVDKTSDHGYDSNQDLEANTGAKENNTNVTTDIFEEDFRDNIFDDTFEPRADAYPDQFDSLNNVENYEHETPDYNEFDYRNEENENDYKNPEDNDYDIETSDNEELLPPTFDRDKAIKDLVIMACNKHRITVPKEYKPEIIRTRKTKIPSDVAEAKDQAVEAKRRKITTEEKTDAQTEIRNLIHLYNSTVVWNTFKKINNELSNKQLDLTDQSLKMYVDEAQNDINAAENAMEEVNDVAANDTPQEIMDEQEDTVIENPKFDEEVYETKQLYLKCKESDAEVFLGSERKLDELLTAVIDKVPIAEGKEIDADANNKKTKTVQNAKEKIKYLYKPDTNKIKYHERFKRWRSKFHYWIRAYRGNNNNIRSKELFENELHSEVPKSLFFILQLCSAICETPPLDIYTYLNIIERKYFKLDSEWKRCSRKKMLRKQKDTEVILSDN